MKLLAGGGPLLAKSTRNASLRAGPNASGVLLTQAGQAARCAFTAECPVKLLCRLPLPVPLAPRRCWCTGLESWPLEQAARICREAGARVAAHVALRDLNLDVPAADRGGGQRPPHCRVRRSPLTRRSLARHLHPQS